MKGHEEMEGEGLLCWDSCRQDNVPGECGLPEYAWVWGGLQVRRPKCPDSICLAGLRVRRVRCHGEGIWLSGHLLPFSICVEALVEPPLWHPVCVTDLLFRSPI